MIEKLNNLLGQNNQLVVLKGQLRNIEKRVKETGEFYFVADLRIPRLNSDDVYATSFNIINLCFSTEYCTKHNIGVDHMKTLKDNEVVMLLSMTSTIFTNKVDKNIYKNNRVLFYVEEHYLTRQVNKERSKTSSYNI